MANQHLRQPLETLHVDGALLKFATVCAVTGRSENTIRRAVRAGTFPKPVHNGPRCTRFRANEVRAWLAAQGAQR